MIDALERRTREHFEDALDQASVLEYVAQWVEGGGTIVGLLAEMSGEREIRRGMLMRYLEDTYGVDVVKRRMELARSEGAHAMVEDAAELAEDAKANKDEIALAKLQIEQKQWLAGRWNRSAYGEPKAGVALQINMGSAFLDSLRRQATSGRVDAGRAPAFLSQANDLPSLPAGEGEPADAIADAIVVEEQDITFDTICT